MTHPSNTPTAEQEQAALHWLSQINEQPALGEGAAFKRWLLADPAHAQAYTQAQVLWRRTEGPARILASDEADVLHRYLQAMDQPVPGRHWRRGGVVAAAACLLLALGTLAGWHPAYWLQDLQADYVTAAGQVQQITLADKSHMTLDASSAVAVEFTEGQRQVRVLRGAAFFQVTHTGEPFVVEAGDGAVHVLGTQFEVRREDTGAQVTVLSGRVGVNATPDQAQEYLVAGQRLVYRDAQLGNVETVDSEARMAWRQGWLNYYQVPLSVVIDDLGRYYPGRILLLDGELAKRTVSGSFPTDQPLAVLDSLGAVLGFKRHTLLGRVTVIR